jgi:hypothetical protein
MINVAVFWVISTMILLMWLGITKAREIRGLKVDLDSSRKAMYRAQGSQRATEYDLTQITLSRARMTAERDDAQALAAGNQNVIDAQKTMIAEHERTIKALYILLNREDGAAQKKRTQSKGKVSARGAGGAMTTVAGRGSGRAPWSCRRVQRTRPD